MTNVPQVIKEGQDEQGTKYSGGLTLVTGVSHGNTPATRIWAGLGGNKPGCRSLPHHHGEAETGCYVLSGHARLYFGESFKEHIDLTAGDYLFVPPGVPHIECNMSETEDMWMVVSRSPSDILVDLPDVDDASLAGFRRV